MLWDTRGNYGGRNGAPKRYRTPFDNLYRGAVDGFQIDLHNQRYEPTIRGISKKLGIDTSTFHKYRSGKVQPPKIILEHLGRLGGAIEPFHWFWDFCSLKITPVLSPIELTGKNQVLLQIEFEDENDLEDGEEPFRKSFQTKQFSMRINNRFREVLYKNTGRVSPVVEQIEWERILDYACDGGWHGPDTEGEFAKSERISRIKP